MQPSAAHGPAPAEKLCNSTHLAVAARPTMTKTKMMKAMELPTAARLSFVFSLQKGRKVPISQQSGQMNPKPNRIHPHVHSKGTWTGISCTTTVPLGSCWATRVGMPLPGGAVAMTIVVPGGPAITPGGSTVDSGTSCPGSHCCWAQRCRGSGTLGWAGATRGCTGCCSTGATGMKVAVTVGRLSSLSKGPLSAEPCGLGGLGCLCWGLAGLRGPPESGSGRAEGPVLVPVPYPFA
mmetsp:Transcript_39724/g.88260  ORF Transcript_39724/g.88260 Transcript_39724/m.88260 type:complete len:236 (-) Transcript_39724:435-1142(-)